MSQLDPYAVLNLPHTFTVDQLRTHYKALARQLHPDKCGDRLSPEQANATFQVLTEAYRALLAVADRAASDKPFYELRSSASASNPPPVNVAMDPHKGFNIQRFNEVFEQERMSDPVRDRGYEKWMRKNDPDRGVGAKDIASNRQMIKYVEPVPVSISRKGGVAYTELGLDRVTDYSRDEMVGDRHGIQYTDYRVAHTTTKLVDESVNDGRPTFATVEELEKHRDSASFTMTDAEAQFFAEQKRVREEAERRRDIKQQEFDRRMSTHYERVHRSLLGYGGTSTF